MNIHIYEIVGIWLVINLINGVEISDEMIDNFIYGFLMVGSASLPGRP